MSLENRVEVPRGNRILDALPPEAYDRLLPALSPVSLELKDLLLESGKAIDTVYFPVSAVVSLLTTMDDGSAVEVATIGNEGIVGVPVFLGAQALGARDFYQVQVPGQVVTVAAGILQKAGFIRYFRGRVAIVDRDGLENASCECYRIIRTEFDRLLP